MVFGRGAEPEGPEVWIAGGLASMPEGSGPPPPYRRADVDGIVRTQLKPGIVGRLLVRSVGV